MEDYINESVGICYSYEDFEKESCDVYQFITEQKGWAYLKSYDEY